MKRLSVLLLLLGLSAACGTSCGFRKAELMWVQQGGKYGFVDRDGKIVINPQFDRAGDFAEGLAPVRLGNKWGFVGTDGKYTVNPQFDDAGGFVDGLAAVRLGDQWGYIGKDGKFVINPQFGLAFRFVDGRARVWSNGKFGFIDKSGKYTANPQFDGAYDYSEKLACVRVGAVWGYVNLDGGTAVNPQYEGALPFSDGLAAVSVAGQVGFINPSGQLVINPQFAAAGMFADGLAPAASGEMKFGFVGRDGTFTITPQFEQTRGFSEGLAAVRLNNKVGYVDKNGTMVVNPQFNNGGSFTGGMAAVEMNDRIGYIDTAGKLVINPQFDDATPLTLVERQILFGASPLTLGQTARGRLEGGRDVVRFRLPVTSTAYVTLDGSDASCRSLVVEGLPDAANAGRCRVSGLFTPGTYSVTLTGDPGNYQLSVSPGVPVIPVGLASRVDAVLGGSPSLFSLDVPASMALQVAVDSYGECDPVMEIMRLNGSVVASDDDSGEGRGALVRRVFDPGKYLVRVRAFQGRGGRIGVAVTEAGNQTQPW